MQTDRMVAQIDGALADEMRTRQLRNLFQQVALAHGQRPSTAQLDEAVGFVVDYVRHVPSLLTAMAAGAERAGVTSAVTPLLAQCEAYWSAGYDLIPDHLGLVGFMDDAYYVLSILHGLAQRHRQASGRHLLEVDLASANRAMRELIGEPHASVLDAAVSTALGAPGMHDVLRRLNLVNAPLVDRDPVWGNASVDQIVDVQMGALGIV